MRSLQGLACSQTPQVPFPSSPPAGRTPTGAAGFGDTSTPRSPLAHACSARSPSLAPLLQPGFWGPSCLSQIPFWSFTHCSRACWAAGQTSKQHLFGLLCATHMCPGVPALHKPPSNPLCPFGGRQATSQIPRGSTGCHHLVPLGPRAAPRPLAVHSSARKLVAKI